MSLLECLLSLQHTKGTLSASPDVVRYSPQHTDLDLAAVQFALSGADAVHSVAGSVSLSFLSGLLHGRRLPPPALCTSAALLRYPHGAHCPRGFGVGGRSLLAVPCVCSHF